jgi:uncharacterized protein (DUF1697 family)
MRYVAFLRAINVGGHTVRMEELRRLFESMGAANVETFIASGNVIFDSTVKKERQLEQQIEAGLEAALKFPVATFLRSLPEVAAVAECPIFSRAEIEKAAALYVGFLKTAPPKAACASVAAASTAVHQFRVHDRELYWLRANRLEDYEGPKFDKALGASTVRSITTIRKIATKHCDPIVGNKKIS